MLANRVALVTGAAQGIGLAISRLLLTNGARVSMLDVDEGLGSAVCRELQREHALDRVMFHHTDVTDRSMLKSSFKNTVEHFGGLDIVFNNAGMANELRWRQMIEVNLVAVIEGTLLAVEHMSIRSGGRGGCIINLASFGGVVPMQFAPCYCASKHGVIGFTRSMQNVLETDGVRVNCLCPEFTDTRMVREGEEFLDKKTKEFIHGIGMLSAETVATAALELALETKRNGSVMTVTRSKGTRYFRFPGDKVEAKL